MKHFNCTIHTLCVFVVQVCQHHTQNASFLSFQILTGFRVYIFSSQLYIRTHVHVSHTIDGTNLNQKFIVMGLVWAKFFHIKYHLLFSHCSFESRFLLPASLRGVLEQIWGSRWVAPINVTYRKRWRPTPWGQRQKNKEPLIFLPKFFFSRSCFCFTGFGGIMGDTKTRRYVVHVHARCEQ